MELTEGQQNLFQDCETWEDAKRIIDSEIENGIQDLKDIDLKIKQSQGEVNNLAQRNATVSSRLQQLQARINQASREDIRSTYDAALEALQRLFVMRGQLERLQSEKKSQKRYLDFLRSLKQFVSIAMNGSGSANSFQVVEMMIQAQESERQRLSRQVHDGPAQALSNFILQTEIASRLFDVDPEKARNELQALKTAATTTFQEVREFIFQLRPMMLDDLGLIPTIKRYVNAENEKTEAEVKILVSGMEKRLEPYIEVVVFRAIQELLNNALHYSQANEIQVHVDLQEAGISVSVDDTGKGFDPRTLPSEGGVGLKLIKERVEMLEGNFEIDSVMGQGSRVSFSIPISKKAKMIG